MNSVSLCALLLLNDIDDVEEGIDYLLGRIRKSVCEIFSSRENEGVFKILIEKHLLDDVVKFKEYFRFTEFSFLVNLVQDDLTTKQCNRVKKPITPAGKLSLTLTYVIGRIHF